MNIGLEVKSALAGIALDCMLTAATRLICATGYEDHCSQL